MSDRRSAILEAAIKVIARRGVRGPARRTGRGRGGRRRLADLLLLRQSQRARARDARARQRAGGDGGRVGEGAALSGREAVERTLLAELGDGDHLRDTSVVWGEVLASAVFEPDLRDQLREASDAWSALVAAAIARGRPRRVDPGRRRRRRLRRAPDRARRRAQLALARRRDDPRARAGAAGGRDRARARRRSSGPAADDAPDEGFALGARRCPLPRPIGPGGP